MKKMKGPETEADRNSEIIAKHRTRMGRVGRGVASC
jgi:hypothetical protein